MKHLKLMLSTISIFMAFSILTGTVLAANGSGTVFTYSNAAYTVPLTTDNAAGGVGGSWVVVDGQTVFIQIAGITEFSVGQSIEVSIGTPSGSVVLGTFVVKTLASGAGVGTIGVGDASAPISWMVGDMDMDRDVDVEFPYCTTMTVHYRSVTGGETYVASGILTGGANHLHVVPEIPLIGTVGASIAMFSGLAVKMRRKRIKT